MESSDVRKDERHFDGCVNFKKRLLSEESSLIRDPSQIYMNIVYMILCNKIFRIFNSLKYLSVKYFESRVSIYHSYSF